jgi:hypothetical protein
VAIVLACGTACILLAGGAEAREEQVGSGPYSRSFIVTNVRNYKIR